MERLVLIPQDAKGTHSAPSRHPTCSGSTRRRVTHTSRMKDADVQVDREDAVRKAAATCPERAIIITT